MSLQNSQEAGTRGPTPPIREIAEGQWESLPNASNADAKWEHTIVQNSGSQKHLEPNPNLTGEFSTSADGAMGSITSNVSSSSEFVSSVVPKSRPTSPLQEFTIGTPYAQTSGAASPEEHGVHPDDASDVSFDVAPKTFSVLPGGAAVGGSLSSVGLVSHVLKVIMLGDASVGKTALIQRFVTGDFAALPYKPTVGADFYSQKLEFTHNRSGEKLLVTLQIWDTAGQERYRSLAASFYRGADVCILVHDASRLASLASIEAWRSDFLLHAAPTDPASFPFLFLRNKCDLLQDSSAASWERHVMEKLGVTGKKQLLSVSAKTGQGVAEAFYTAARLGLRRAQTAVAAVRHQQRAPTVSLASIPYLDDAGDNAFSTCKC